MSNDAVIETSLDVERVGFDVADQRICAIALETIYLAVERFIISETPTNTTAGTAFKRRINDFNYRAKNVYHCRGLVI